MRAAQQQLSKTMKWKALVEELANRINQPHVIDIYMRKVFKAGMDKGKEDLLALPLASRLTNAEREKIRAEYHKSYSAAFDNTTCLDRQYARGRYQVLREIFGKEMFNTENK